MDGNGYFLRFKRRFNQIKSIIIKYIFSKLKLNMSVKDRFKSNFLFNFEVTIPSFDDYIMRKQGCIIKKRNNTQIDSLVKEYSLSFGILTEDLNSSLMLRFCAQYMSYLKQYDDCCPLIDLKSNRLYIKVFETLMFFAASINPLCTDKEDPLDYRMRCNFIKTFIYQQSDIMFYFVDETEGIKENNILFKEFIFHSCQANSVDDVNELLKDMFVIHCVNEDQKETATDYFERNFNKIETASQYYFYYDKRDNYKNILHFIYINNSIDKPLFTFISNKLKSTVLTKRSFSNQFSTYLDFNLQQIYHLSNESLSELKDNVFTIKKRVKKIENKVISPNMIYPDKNNDVHYYSKIEKDHLDIFIENSNKMSITPSVKNDYNNIMLTFTNTDKADYSHLDKKSLWIKIPTKKGILKGVTKEYYSAKRDENGMEVLTYQLLSSNNSDEEEEDE